MPRINLRHVRLAKASNPHLIPLLRATRTLDQAQAELRWIKKELPREQWTSAIRRRASLEPLSYVLGTQFFGGLELLCEKEVLIPRWETEEWTMRLIDVLKDIEHDGMKILDACTGTGCIPLLIKNELPTTKVTALDWSDDALSLAKKNREKYRLDVDILKQNVLAPLSRQDRLFTLITSNPPYIPLEDYEKPLALNGPEASVKRYEPRMALVGHLEFYQALVDFFVKTPGCEGLVFEVGYDDQAAETAARLPQGWSYGRYYDSSGNIRCVVAWKEGSKMEKLRQMVNESAAD